MAGTEVRIYSLSQVAGQCVIVLEEIHGPRLLPIWIGLYEGGAIGMALSEQDFPRPLTHDLIMKVIAAAGGELKRVTITELQDATFYAELVLGTASGDVVVDARPSDSIAMAVRAKCPIFVDERVFSACPEMLKPISEEEVEDFRKKLDKMTPEDFFKDLKRKGPDESGAAGE